MAVSYPLEKFERHAECNKGMDISAPFGWWCCNHNVNLTEPEEEA